jgi:hypothetical protein
MPRTLRAVRVLLYLTAVLGLFAMSFMLIGIAVMTEDEVLQEMDMGKGATFALMVPLVVCYVLMFYLAATLRRGGRVRQWFVRVPMALLLLSGLVGLVTGDVSGVLEVLFAALILLLHESRTARTWYRSQTSSETAAGEVTQTPGAPTS